MAAEIWHEFGEQAPPSLTPVANGRLEVYAAGEKLYDRKDEGGAYPDMNRVRSIKQAICGSWPLWRDNTARLSAAPC
jgi:predicted Rdx family selenoprotein